MPATDVVLRMRGVRKRFGAVQALAGVDLEVRRGEVHALLGENGAGKSTLMKVLSGAYRPDAGELELEGRPFAPEGPHDAVFAMGGDQLRVVRSGRWKLHARLPRPGFRCLSDEDAADWVDPRGPDGITIIAQYEQARPNQCPGVVTGPAPAAGQLFDLESDRAEQTDVAAQHPEVVARLMDLFQTLDAEAPGQVQNPAPRQPLLRLQGGELRYDREIEPVQVR